MATYGSGNHKATIIRETKTTITAEVKFPTGETEIKRFKKVVGLDQANEIMPKGSRIVPGKLYF